MHVVVQDHHHRHVPAGLQASDEIDTVYQDLALIDELSVLGKDVGSDVAVIHVNPAGLTLHPLPLGDSAALAVGEPLAVVGDPLGFDRSLSIGVVSALDRSIQALTAMRSRTPFRPTPR